MRPGRRELEGGGDPCPPGPAPIFHFAPAPDTSAPTSLLEIETERSPVRQREEELNNGLQETQSATESHR